MKKTFLLMGCLALLVAGCSKEKNLEVPNEIPQEGPERHLIVNITVNQETSDTRAVKTDWEKGDKVYVVFDNYFGDQASGKIYYMTLTYNGQRWSSTLSDPDLETYLLSPEHATGLLAAFYTDATFPVGGTPEFMDVSTEGEYFELLVKDPAPGLVMSVDHEYYHVENDILEAVLSLELPLPNMVHFFIDGVSEELAARLSFSNAYIRPVFFYDFWCSASYISPMALVVGSSDGDPIPGAYYQGGISFCGQLKQEMVNVPTQYVIQVVDNRNTPKDASDDITYTLTKENTALKGLKSVKLPELSSGRWTVTGTELPTVDLWLDPNSIQLITEANFDNWIPEVHFNNQYGYARIVVSASLGFSGEGVTVNVTSDSNEWLSCFGGGGSIIVLPNVQNPDEQPRVATITVTVTSEDGIDTVTRTIKVYQDGLASPIKFASQAVKEIAVSKWDKNADGELSYAEAAAVESLDGAFKTIPKTTEFSFDELEFFTELTEIGDYEFENLSLTSIRLPGKITRIGYEAFMGTMIEEIYIPEGVTELSYFVFDSAPLKFLNIPASLTHMWSNPVIGCEDLATLTVSEGNPVYTSPEGSNAIIWIDTDTGLKTLFAGCKNTVIPDDVEAIGYNAFSGCSGLQSIEIPSSVQVIQPFAFAYSGLKSVVIPASVTSIGFGAFYHFDGESKLERIIVLATTPQPFTEQMLGLYDETFPIYVPTESVGLYKNAWPEYAARIQGMMSVNFDGYRPEIEW